MDRERLRWFGPTTYRVSCDHLCPSRDAALGEPRASISLGFCFDCEHIFNVEYDSARLNYLPVTRIHCEEELAQEHFRIGPYIAIRQGEAHGTNCRSASSPTVDLRTRESAVGSKDFTHAFRNVVHRRTCEVRSCRF